MEQGQPVGIVYEMMSLCRETDGLLPCSYVNRPQVAVIQCLQVCQTLQDMACWLVSSMQPINLRDHSCIVAVAQNDPPSVNLAPYCYRYDYREPFFEGNCLQAPVPVPLYLELVWR